MHELTAANQAAHLQHAGSCCHSAFATVKLLYLVHRWDFYCCFPNKYAE